MLPFSGRRLALLTEGDRKPSVYIEIRLEILHRRVGIMSDFEIIAIMLSLLGIVVQLLIELINAKK